MEFRTGSDPEVDVDYTCPRCQASVGLRDDELTGTVHGAPCPECGATLVFLKRPAPAEPSANGRERSPTRARPGATRSRRSGRSGALEKRRARDRRFSRLAALVVATVVVGGAGGLIASIKSSDAYREARVFVKANAEVRSQVGSSMKFNWFPTGKFADDEARISFHVEGTRGEAEVALRMVRTAEGWFPAEAIMEADGERTALGVPPGAVAAGAVDLPSLSRAWDMYEAGDHGEALSQIERRLQMAPGDAETLYWKGRMLAGMNRGEEAVRALRRAVETRSDYPEAHRQLGYVLATLGRPAAAVEALDAAIRLDPTSGWAHYNRGRAHYEMGNRSAARRDVREACRLDYQQGCEVSRQLSGSGQDAP